MTGIGFSLAALTQLTPRVLRIKRHISKQNSKPRMTSTKKTSTRKSVARLLLATYHRFVLHHVIHPTHAAHATHAAAVVVAGVVVFLPGRFADDAVGGEQQN